MVDQVQNGEQQFLDMNGDPLSGGFVYMYIVGTSTFNNTWSDSGGTVLNTNPIVLDQAGRALIWGTGLYRQVVTDQFGNVQWDRVTQAGISPTDSLTVASLSVSGNATVGGTLTVNGTANSVINGGLVVNPGPGQTEAIQANGSIGILTVNGSVDLITGEKIIVRGGNTPGITFSNTTDNLSMGWYEGGNALVSAIMDGNGLPVTNFAFIPGIGENAGSVITSGRMLQAKSTDSPCVNVFNTLDGIAWSMQASSGVLQWGTSDANGLAFHVLMKLAPSTGGLTLYEGGIFPQNPHALDIGETLVPWRNIVAGAFVTASTDADSELLADGQLEAVKNTPVKTGTHVGIAHADCAAVPGAKHSEEGGVNQGALIGVLWKALQELSAEHELLRQQFESYVTSRP